MTDKKDDNEDSKNKKPKSISKKVKPLSLNDSIKMYDDKGKETNLEELSEEQLREAFSGLLGSIGKLKEEMNKANTSYDLSLKRANQDLEINAHEVNRKKLFTLFDVITNTKELLVQRINEHGKADMQHVIDEGTKKAANNTIKLCLKQVFLWIESHDINPKPEKNNENKETKFKGTNPDDITDKDLFL